MCRHLEKRIDFFFGCERAEGKVVHAPSGPAASRRTAQRQLAGGSAGGQSDVARSPRPSVARLSPARTTPVAHVP
jgi:hypothetical protein